MTHSGPVIFLYAIVAALLVALISLSGMVFRLMRPSVVARILPKVIGIGTGLLLGNAFLHMIPEGFELIGSISSVSTMVLAGMIFFFVLEKTFHNKVSSTGMVTVDKLVVTHLGRMNLAGDVIHNFIDGTLIALGFVASPEVGVTTTLAIAAHELPQELSKTGSMLFSGYSLQRTVRLNFIASLSTVLGVVIVMVIEHSLTRYVAYLIPFTAGGFIYIATHNMMPALQRVCSFSVQWITIAVGIFVAILLSNF